MTMELRHFEELDSTMSKARELCGTETAGSFFGVLADLQRAGRGRVPGRTWEAAPGKALLLTLAIKDLEAYVPALPLKAGLAAYDTFAGYGAELAVKWPNDLMARTGETGSTWKKLAGLLCERTGAWTLVGLGVNLLEGSCPASLENRGISLEACVALPAAAQGSSSLAWRLELCQSFGKAFLGRLKDPNWRAAYLERMWGLHAWVGFGVGHPGAQKLKRGVLEGVDTSGSILIQDATGAIASYASGEIETLRPV
jgi:BirA family biotin operon repressor/biotin-[acetyl-CoA-carboxylase] ligase